MAKAKTLTDAQKTALDEADKILERAFQEAGGKVKAAHPGNDNNFGHCLRCDCGGYVQPTGLGAHSQKCQREGCGHLFGSHFVF